MLSSSLGRDGKDTDIERVQRIGQYQEWGNLRKIVVVLADPIKPIDLYSLC